jgi:hypothetical protein
LKISKLGSKIKIVWNPGDSEDIKKAKEFFLKQTRQGWLAAVHHTEYKRILKFDSEYGELWFIPLIEGG